MTMKNLRFNSIAPSLKLKLAAAALVSLVSASAYATEFKVIANTSVSASSISSGDLKGIFLEDSDSLSGSHVLPVLQKTGSTHEAFARQYLNRTPSALDVYYRTLVFTGKASMPKVLGTDAEVIAYVAKTKGAIGYVSNGSSAEGVKTLAVK
jgi:hypothetical protein